MRWTLSPAVSSYVVWWGGLGGCHGDKRPHVLRASIWSKDPIVLVLSCLHWACRMGERGFPPSHAKEKTLSTIILTPTLAYTHANDTSSPQVLHVRRSREHVKVRRSKRVHNKYIKCLITINWLIYCSHKAGYGQIINKTLDIINSCKVIPVIPNFGKSNTMLLKHSLSKQKFLSSRQTQWDYKCECEWPVWPYLLPVK